MAASWNTSASHPPFVPASPCDKRSPCPALNALANHGYLPHDGTNIDLWQLITAMRTVYNLSFPLAALLALAGILFCGHAWRLRLDLDALARHNRIEHNGSLVHADTPPGHTAAPVPVDPKLLCSFLARAHPDKGMSLDGLARVRADREAALDVPLNPIHSEIGKGEAALCWLLLKSEDGRVPVSTLAQWFGEERIPDNWIPPTKSLGLWHARKIASQVSELMKQVRK